MQNDRLRNKKKTETKSPPLFGAATPMKQCVTALGIALNAAGAFLAMNLRLPIYMDSIGTMFVASLLGPVYGGLTGLLGGIVSGFVFDVYSFYYAPAQMLTGLMAGYFFRTAWMKGKKMPAGTFVVTLPCTLLSAVVTALVFGGVTSSGSSVIVLFLGKLGVPLSAGVFCVQILTDYLDKFAAVTAVSALLRGMTHEMKLKIQGE